MMDWLSAAVTHRGNVRELNEDAYMAHPEHGVWAVADGMGGHHAGDVASRRVVETLADITASTTLTDLEADCRARLQDTNLQLLEHGRKHNHQIVGCTVVCLLAVADQAVVLWAGDSRAYRLRAGKLEALTRDHSRTNDLIELGALSPEEAESHPEANVITRAVGVVADLELDAAHLEVAVGDTYLLCSDGLNRCVTEAEIAASLSLESCNAAAESLMASALETDARDNISVVVVRTVPADEDVTILNLEETTEPYPADDDATLLSEK